MMLSLANLDLSFMRSTKLLESHACPLRNLSHTDTISATRSHH